MHLRKLYGFLFLIGMHCSQISDEQIQSQANGIFDAIQKQLLGSLTKSLLDKGPVASIPACQQISQDTMKQYSHSQWSIKRVSLKPRNPENSVDAWERSVLEKWEKDPSTRKMILIRSTKEVRILRPITIGSPTCLQCHGSTKEILPAVYEQIQSVYPEDKAIGYSMGDLRGAFSATYVLP